MAGDRRRSTRTAPVYDPATGHEQRHVLLAEPADVDAAVQAAKAAFAELERRLRRAPRAHHVRLPRADRRSTPTSSRGSSPPSTARPSRTPRARSSAAWRSSSSPAGSRELLKGEFSEQVSTDVDLHSFRQPLGVCAGITPFNFPIMVPLWMHPIAIATGNTFVLKPSERDPSVSNRRRRALRARPACPTASSTSCTATRWPSTRCSTTRTSRRSRFVGSTPIAKYIHERATRDRQARAGARRREEPRDRDARRRPRLRRRPAHRRRLRLGRPALHGDLRRRRGRRRRPTTLVEQLRAKALADQGRPGPRPRLRDGPGRHRARRATASSTTSAAARRDVVVDGREIDKRGRRLLGRPDAARQRHHRHGRLHRRDLRPGARRSSASTASTRRSTLINRNRYANGVGDLHRAPATPRARSSAGSRSG